MMALCSVCDNCYGVVCVVWMRRMELCSACDDCYGVGEKDGTVL